MPGAANKKTSHPSSRKQYNLRKRISKQQPKLVFPFHRLPIEIAFKILTALADLEPKSLPNLLLVSKAVNAALRRSAFENIHIWAAKKFDRLVSEGLPKLDGIGSAELSSVGKSSKAPEKKRQRKTAEKGKTTRGMTPSVGRRLTIHTNRWDDITGLIRSSRWKKAYREQIESLALILCDESAIDAEEEPEGNTLSLWMYDYLPKLKRLYINFDIAERVIEYGGSDDGSVVISDLEDEYLKYKLLKDFEEDDDDDEEEANDGGDNDENDDDSYDDFVYQHNLRKWFSSPSPEPELRSKNIKLECLAIAVEKNYGELVTEIQIPRHLRTAIRFLPHLNRIFLFEFVTTGDVPEIPVASRRMAREFDQKTKVRLIVNVLYTNRFGYEFNKEEEGEDFPVVRFPNGLTLFTIVVQVPDSEIIVKELNEEESLLVPDHYRNDFDEMGLKRPKSVMSLMQNVVDECEREWMPEVTGRLTSRCGPDPTYLLPIPKKANVEIEVRPLSRSPTPKEEEE